MGVGLSCRILSEKMRGNSLNLHQGRVRLDTRKNYSLKGWSDFRINCPGSWWGQSLEVFKRCQDVHLGIQFRGDYGSDRLSLELRRS